MSSRLNFLDFRLREVKEFYAETTGPKAMLYVHYTCIEQKLKVKLVILYSRHGVKCLYFLLRQLGPRLRCMYMY